MVLSRTLGAVACRFRTNFSALARKKCSVTGIQLTLRSPSCTERVKSTVCREKQRPIGLIGWTELLGLLRALAGARAATTRNGSAAVVPTTWSHGGGKGAPSYAQHEQQLPSGDGTTTYASRCSNR
jgi:hypothetical protein